MGLCYCGNEESYDACCGRFHSSLEAPATAELLMRSRYSAYVLTLEDYLLSTWQANARPALLDFPDGSKTKWLGLDIKRYKLIDTCRAQVEFIARYKIGGLPAVRLHEISDFIFEEGRWFYVSGVFST
jgi:SEC-C motif domain protein